MLADLFRGLFDTDMTQVITPGEFLLCVASALVIGVLLAGFYMYVPQPIYQELRGHSGTASRCGVCDYYDGQRQCGTGVAVAGAFSLVRFRSVPGSAKEIGAIFLAMGTGLIVGMGYLGYAFLCAILLGLAGLVFNRLDFGSQKKASLYKTLHITIPEDLDYTDVFQPIWEEYASSCELTQVKTSNMGSLFRLTYNLPLRSPGKKRK